MIRAQSPSTLLDRERLAVKRLRDLLGRVVGLCADGRNVRGAGTHIHHVGRIRGSSRA